MILRLVCICLVSVKDKTPSLLISPSHPPPSSQPPLHQHFTLVPVAAMTSVDNTNLLDFYTNNLTPDLVKLGSCLANLDFDKHFYIQVNSGVPGNHSHLDQKSHKEKSFLIFGEVSSFENGTKLGATGNHFKGKPGDLVGIELFRNKHKL